MTSPKSTASLTEVIFPAHANHRGTLFAGHALLLMSKAAFLAGRACAQSDVVMACVADTQFLAPVPVGSVLRLEAWVTRIGRTSLTVCVTGVAERLGQEATTALTGVFEMVAVDGGGRPVPVPGAYSTKEVA